MPSAYDRIRLPQVQHGEDRHRNTPVNGPLEREEERYASRRDRDGKSRSSTRGFMPDTAATDPARHITTASKETVVSHSDPRPPSRNATAPRDAPYSQTQLQSDLSQKLRSETPELRNGHAPSHKRAQATLTRRSSFEHILGAVDNRDTNALRRAHNGVRIPMEATRDHTDYGATSSRRHRDRDHDRAKEERREKLPDRGNEDRARIERKAREKEKARVYEPRRESERTREAERVREYERPVDRRREYLSDTEHRSSSRRTPSSNRAEESDLSDGGRRPAEIIRSHRRHRTEDGTQPTTSVRRLVDIHRTKPRY